MIYIGGEPPFIEKPEPRFGGVIGSLNKLVNMLSERDTQFTENTNKKLKEIDDAINAYVTNLPKIVTEHKNIVGTAHGETKKTVGLPLRENVRNATTAEVTSFANVNAVVKITDLKTVLDSNMRNDLDGYQKNDMFPMGGYNEPRLLPVGNTFTTPDIIHKYKYAHVNMMASGDRLLVSARPDGNEDHYSLLYSDPTRVTKNSFEELPFATTYFNGWGWNMTSGGTIDGKVGLFRPVPDKGVFVFYTGLFKTPGTNYLMYTNFGEMIYRGVAMHAEVSGSKITIEHKLFTVRDPLGSAPTLVNSLPDTYQSSYETINQKGVVGPFLKNTVYNLTDFVELVDGVTIEYDTSNPIPFSPTMVWYSADTTYYANLAVPVVFTSGEVKVKKVLTFTEVRTPGNLAPGSFGKVTMLNGQVKDRIGASLDFTGSNFFADNDVTNPSNPVNLPGAILKDGMLLNAVSGAKSVRIKYSQSVFNDTVSFIEGMTANTRTPQGITRRYCSRRYDAFGAIPERVFPVYNQAGETRMFTMSLNDVRGMMEWREYKWFSEDIFRNTSSWHSFSVKKPDEVSRIKNYELIPKSLSVYGGMATGVNIYSLCFTPANNYTGYTNVILNKDGVELGDRVTMEPSTQMACLGLMKSFTERAAGAYGTGYDKLELNNFYCIHAIDADRAMLMYSDGITYVEGALVGYSVTNGLFRLTGEILKTQLKLLSSVQKVPDGYTRKSASKDDLSYMYQDLYIWRQAASGLHMSYPRAFGDVLGDVSFFITGTTVTPIKTNAARFHDNKFVVDMPEELHPPVIIPRKAMIYDTGVVPNNDTDLTTMYSVASGNVTFDPYVAPDKSFFLVPHGKRLMVGGRGIIVDTSIYVGIPDTGDWWCYLVREGNGVKLITDRVMREPDNNEVLIVRRVGGVYIYSEEYIVIDNHLLSFDRHGSSIPVTWDDGTLMGVNKFFKKTDILPG